MGAKTDRGAGNPYHTPLTLYLSLSLSGLLSACILAVFFSFFNAFCVFVHLYRII